MELLLDEALTLIRDLELAYESQDTGKSLFSREVSSLIPVMIRSLQKIENCLRDPTLDALMCMKQVRGLGRLAIEYEEFSESELGNRVLQLVNQLENEYFH